MKHKLWTILKVSLRVKYHKFHLVKFNPYSHTLVTYPDSIENIDFIAKYKIF